MRFPLLPSTLAASALLLSGVAVANGPPPHAGPPDHAGPPEHAGGPPGNPGRPAHAGRPAFLDDPEFLALRGQGRPENPGTPDAHLLRMRGGNAGPGRTGSGTFTPLPTQAGASHVAHVGFAVLDEEGAVIEEAARGRMTWFWIGTRFGFILNGHALAASAGYVLVSLPPETEEEGEPAAAWCVAAGTSNPGGNLHLLGSIELDSHIPADLDPDSILDAEPDAEAPAGAIFVLVPQAEVTCEEQEHGPSIASFSEEAAPGSWLVSVQDVHYIDSDLLDEEEEGGE